MLAMHERPYLQMGQPESLLHKSNKGLIFFRLCHRTNEGAEQNLFFRKYDKNNLKPVHKNISHNLKGYWIGDSFLKFEDMYLQPYLV